MRLRTLTRHIRELHTPMRNRHFIVVPGLKLIYARVPKAANSSIKHVLATHIEWKRRKDRVGPNNDVFWMEGGGQGTDLVGAKAAVSRFSDYFMFTYVRNPFDRVVSCYNNKIRIKDEIQPSFRKLGFRLGMSFPEFAELALSIKDDRADNHFRGQVDILSLNGKLLPEFTGRVEDASDWGRLQDIVRDRCGFDIGPMQARHVNRENRDDLAEYYADPALIRMVQDRYRDDFEQFYPDASDLESTLRQLNATPDA